MLDIEDHNSEKDQLANESQKWRLLLHQLLNAPTTALGFSTSALRELYRHRDRYRVSSVTVMFSEKPSRMDETASRRRPSGRMSGTGILKAMSMLPKMSFHSGELVKSTPADRIERRPMQWPRHQHGQGDIGLFCPAVTPFSSCFVPGSETSCLSLDGFRCWPLTIFRFTCSLRLVIFDLDAIPCPAHRPAIPECDVAVDLTRAYLPIPAKRK